LRLLTVLLSAAAVLATAQAAAAQPAPPADDAVCLLDMVALSNSSNPEAQRAGQEGVLFFVGRISAHTPGFDFSRLKTMAATMNAQAAQAALQQTCGPLLQNYMQKLDAALSPPASAPAPAPATPPNVH